MDTILPTTLVGSYPQPDWLIDRAKLAGRFPPRVRAKELWRVAPEWLEQAQDDATLLAIRDQERAGLDIITDGEMRQKPVWRLPSRETMLEVRRGHDRLLDVQIAAIC